MRITRITYSTTGAAGFTAPIPVSYLQPTFNVALGVIPSAAATGLSCKAQYTLDDQSTKRQVNWTQTTTVVTITDGTQPFGMGASSLSSQQNPHGLVTGDTVNIEGTGNFDGNYAVTVTNPTSLTASASAGTIACHGVGTA